MTRPSQIRRIVAELREVLGPDVPAWELLQLAYHFVEAHRAPEIDDYDEPAVRNSFFAAEVDLAFQRDNGWKVVDFERQQGMAFSDELPDSYYRTEARLRSLIGRTIWPRTETD